MISIASILAALSWRLIAVVALAGVIFVGGCQFGENRVTTKWDSEKIANAHVVAKQAEHVDSINAQESSINQEISNEFQKAKAVISTDGRDLFARVPVRVRVHAAGLDSAVSGVPDSPRRTAADPSDAVPATGQPTDNATCEKLAEDAAQTTLMLVEFQQWYRKQARNFNMPAE